MEHVNVGRNLGLKASGRRILPTGMIVLLALTLSGCITSNGASANAGKPFSVGMARPVANVVPRIVNFNYAEWDNSRHSYVVKDHYLSASQIKAVANNADEWTATATISSNACRADATIRWSIVAKVTWSNGKVEANDSKKDPMIVKTGKVCG